MDELLKIPNCVADKSQMLRSVYDQLNVHIRGLAALNVNTEQYGSLLIPMITFKLPNDVQLRVARKMREDVWRIDDLLEILSEKLRLEKLAKGR